ncbi:GMC oxidoreductase [Streptomyces sp. NPDC127084]|uniref:GMC oxidoreductase n=1 Tax=Streptomyces sp. NPDC127084 TaxID=3347133 RepID=UPI00365714AE
MTDIRYETDTLIVGSGPIGATFARALVQAGHSVLMLEAGAQLSADPGMNLKNTYVHQHDTSLFSSIIRGHLHILSVSNSARAEFAVEPTAAREPTTNHGRVRFTENPEQDTYRNIPAASVCYAVGGMATHWTCATPRHHPLLERYDGVPEEDWDRFYSDAEHILGVSSREFDHSVRQRLLIDALRGEFHELPEPYGVQSLPLAAERRAGNPSMVRWAGSDTVLGDIAHGDPRFSLLPQHLCTRLIPDATGSRIVSAEARDLLESRMVRIEADHYVVAAGAVLTPQLLWASGIRPKALGRYLTEHPMAFCQVVLHSDLLDRLRSDPLFVSERRCHREASPDGDVLIPMDDPEPNVWIPVSANRPWHAQINRDAFQYGDLPSYVDDRLIVDLRWFGLIDPRPDNRVTFSAAHTDLHGMPQPTFDFTFSDDDTARQHAMMTDMLRAAPVLGKYLPGSEPEFGTLGLPNHIAGTVRMGQDPDHSVVNGDSRVWDFENLYLGGNGVIPTGTASNPTLTSMALALMAVDHLTQGASSPSTRSSRSRGPSAGPVERGS